MMIACVNQSASAHDDIIRNQAFSINLLNSGQSEFVAIFSGKRGLSGDDRFIDGNWVDGPRSQPMLLGAVASFECFLHDAREHGSHTVLVGQVGHVVIDADREAMIYARGGIGRALLSGATGKA